MTARSASPPACIWRYASAACASGKVEGHRSHQTADAELEYVDQL
jgi:hypothetical protein